MSIQTEIASIRSELARMGEWDEETGLDSEDYERLIYKMDLKLSYLNRLVDERDRRYDQ